MYAEKTVTELEDSVELKPYARNPVGDVPAAPDTFAAPFVSDKAVVKFTV